MRKAKRPIIHVILLKKDRAIRLFDFEQNLDKNLDAIEKYFNTNIQS